MRRHAGSSFALVVGMIGILLGCAGCTSRGSAAGPRSTTATLPPLASVRVVDGNPVVPGEGYSNPLHFGESVPSGLIDDQDMIGGGTGFGLTGEGSPHLARKYDGGFQYPAKTTDGGSSWLIDSPWWFAAPIADGAAFVNTIGGASPQVAWAWGPPGQATYTTVDGGLQWWRTSFPGGVSSIAQSPTGNLVATVKSGGETSGLPGTYSSSDGGRFWEYTGVTTTGAAAKTTAPITATTVAGSRVSSGIPRGCRSDQLRLSLVKTLPSNSNQGGAFFQLQNTSGVECSLYGYPGFEALSGSGSVEPVEVSRGPSYGINDPGPHLVYLLPGQATYFGVGWTIFDMIKNTSQGCIETAQVESVPPNALTALDTTAALGHICPEGGGIPKVTITAVAPKNAFVTAAP